MDSKRFLAPLWRFVTLTNSPSSSKAAPAPAMVSASPSTGIPQQQPKVSVTGQQEASTGQGQRARKASSTSNFLGIPSNFYMKIIYLQNNKIFKTFLQRGKEEF